MPADRHRLASAVARPLRRGDDDADRAVGDQAAVEQVQRIDDQREFWWSSSVIGSRMTAFGFIDACLRQATAIQPRCSLRVP